MIASLLETEELTPELESMLIINQQELSEKSIYFSKEIFNRESNINQRNLEIQRLKEANEKDQRVVDRKKQAIKNAMLSAGIDKIESSLFKLSLRRSESVEVISIDQLPESLTVVKKTVSADKMKIKEQIKNGVHVEGAVLVENFNLTIK
jgi:asparagine synthetase B (glutamine-hydrolysing)